jgi:hypothetical protein
MRILITDCWDKPNMIDSHAGKIGAFKGVPHPIATHPSNNIIS